MVRVAQEFDAFAADGSDEGSQPSLFGPVLRSPRVTHHSIGGRIGLTNSDDAINIKKDIFYYSLFYPVHVIHLRDE